MFFKKKKVKSASTEQTDKLEKGLAKTKKSIFGGLFSSFGNADTSEIVGALEARLIGADVGIATTNKILEKLKKNLKNNTDTQQWQKALRDEFTAILSAVDEPLAAKNHTPFVILVVGVNGAGKTTTIGKMAQLFKSNGQSVMLAAGDTFRAAAVAQLQKWGADNDIAVVSQGQSADSASVIFDAIASARAKKIDVLIADTAGRLHTQDHLMTELGKIKRVIQKHDEAYPHETLLVLDASIGQNALSQVDKFNELLDLSGIALTKMDGTAKGGVILALADKTGLPIRYIGVGEKSTDLKPFSANDFISAIMGSETGSNAKK